MHKRTHMCVFVCVMIKASDKGKVASPLTDTRPGKWSSGPWAM